MNAGDISERENCTKLPEMTLVTKQRYMLKSYSSEELNSFSKETYMLKET